MKRSTIVILVLVSVPFAALDVALYLAGKFRVEAVITFFAVFAVMMGAYWFRRIRGEKVEKDERTIRIAQRAGSFSWMISFYVAALLAGSDTLGLLRLSSAQSLTIILMVMSFSYLILIFVMNRKGDIE